MGSMPPHDSGDLGFDLVVDPLACMLPNAVYSGGGHSLSPQIVAGSKYDSPLFVPIRGPPLPMP
jgi:hypothetical protein